jgi:nondiscriminating glutamyl-tRNA synthetase
MTNKPIVRIAPSPTGYLHVGTARMAACNYLFARHYDGIFRVRIEDTDLSRSQPELIEPILSALKWLGMQWDDEILYQSKRLDYYGKFAQQLLENGHAYRCFSSREQLDEDRKRDREAGKSLKLYRRSLQLSEGEIEKKLEAGEEYTIRLKIPEGETSFTDLVLGGISRSSDDIEDLIIARSDGSATYNLAVVVDDHDMGITHVIRGNDHVTNTFKQIHLYRAFGWELPKFGHVPLILRPDKRKVSKRLGDKDVQQYQQEGILPEALFNYLSLLGWSPKTEREIYTRDELVEIFDERNFNPSNAVFDEEKLLAFNFEHIQKLSGHEIATLVAPLLVAANIQSRYWFETRWDYLRKVMELLKERARRVTDFVELGSYFFEFDYQYDSEAEAKYFKPETAELLSSLADRFERLDEFDLSSTEKALSDLAEERGMKRGRLIHPTRLAVSGRSKGPGLFDILVTLGKSAVVQRMRKAVDYIAEKAQS